MKTIYRPIIVILLILLLGCLIPDSSTTATAALPEVADLGETKPLRSTKLPIDFIGHLGGITQAVTIQGNYAYIGEGPALTILDISNPSLPVVVGRSQPMPEIIEHIVVAGQYAYVADSDGGLRIIDISNPTNPFEIGFFDTPYDAVDLDVSGNYVYLAEENYGIYVLDVSDPANPLEVSFYDMHLSSVFEVKVSGSYAYIAHGDSGLRVIDITNPANLVEIGHLDNYYYIESIAISGDYAYLADSKAYNAGLRVVDISDPTNPVEVGYCNTGPLNAHFVAVSGSHAFLIVDYGSYMIDISDPTQPVKSSLYSDLWGYEVALSGSYAYLAKHSYGLRIVEMSDPQNLLEIGSYQGLGEARNAVASGNYLYVAGRYSGLRIFDISTPSMPLEIGNYATPYALDITLAGNYAYLAGGRLYGLRIIDVTNPTAPVEVGYLDTPGDANEVSIAGNYAYIADGKSGLRIIDISNPTSPVEVGIYNQYAVGAEISGNLAYVACGASGFRIVNISSPNNPFEVGYFDTYVYDVAVSAGYAYIMGQGSMKILNVTAPGNLFEVGRYESPNLMNDIVIFENYAYLTSSDGLLVVDISNPNEPFEVASYRTPDIAIGINTSLEYIFLSSSWSGLYILHFTSPIANTSFRPEIDGYHFENYGGISLTDYSIASLRRIFGDDAVCWVVNGSTCIPDPRALEWYLKTSWKLQGGRCYGFSVTSLRFFTGIDSYLWADYVYALDKSSDVTITWNNQSFLARASENIAFFHYMQAIEPVKTNIYQAAGKLPNEVLNDLLQAMTNGWSDPMVLVLVNGRQGHAVSPYAITNPSGDTYQVYVYDNEHPGDSSRYITFDVGNQTWSYDTGSGIWSGGPEAYTIAAVPISDNDQTMQCPWCESALENGTAMQTLMLDGAGRLLITDSQGRRIGYIGNQYISEIPQGFGQVPILGTHLESEPFYTLPLTETYTILLDGQTLTQTSTTSLSQFGPGYAVTVEDMIITPETQDQITIASSGEQVVYQADQAQTPNITLIFDYQDVNFEIQLNGVDIGAGEAIQLFADSSVGELILNGNQASGGGYALAIGQTNATGQNKFLHSDIPILAADTHFIDFGNWDGSGTIILKIDHQSDGTIDEIVELENQIIQTSYLPLVLFGR